MFGWLKKKQEVGALQIAVSLRQLSTTATDDEISEFRIRLARQARLVISGLRKTKWREVIETGGKNCERIAGNVIKEFEATKPSLTDVEAVALGALVTRLAAANSSHPDDMLGCEMIDDEIQTALQLSSDAPWTVEQ